MPALPDRLWQAIATRDRTADGLFVYGVHSTGIYCRPSCPSRRPRRSGISYFPASSMAESAGFRACLRCRPDQALALTGVELAIARACAAMAQQPENRWESAALAAISGTPSATLRRAFRRHLGITPREYLAACRQREFKQRLRRGDPISDATYGAGYSSPSAIYAVPNGDMTPAAYRKGGAGVDVGWTTVATRFGRVLVAATRKGLCFVAIGATEQEVVRAVRAEFPAATITRSSSDLIRHLAEQAQRAADGHLISPPIPADIAGTAFQWRVWLALARVPAKQRQTYAGLAATIGAPAAVRAVAAACARNPLALVVPCHRIIGSDGQLRGYRWGVAVKRALLTAEGIDLDIPPQ